MNIKKYKNKTIEIFKSIFLFLKKICKWIQEKLATHIIKEQNNDDFFQTNKITKRRIYNNIKQYGQISLALGQILLFLLVAGSTLNYGKFYVLDLHYQVDLTFEQFITFGFSNIIYVILYMFLLYIPIELAIITKKFSPKFTVLDLIVFIFAIAYLYIFSSLVLLFSIKDFNFFKFICFVYFIFIIISSYFILLNKTKKYNQFRFISIIIIFCVFLATDYNTTRMSGMGEYNATIIVDKNSFIKDIIDIEDKKEKYTKNYHYKGEHIELKDVKVLSTLGDIAYVELCSENIEIGKTLEKDCEKSIRVEFIKKDIHIIRDGKKQNVTNTENGSNKTNNESKEQNEQDLEKSKENKKEESTTKNN
ncbi:hypothetical protein AVBRAN12642_07000 [Campylobacter sp. RM12642]|uniref:hypothetical protein n=1 Tax=unclassified Campylobacter TaxID=2593542 RepID=UPI001DE35C79|nr:hypothetical protein [Campylobacter sp. RM12642]MBZ8008152.1 hypothetical protein [Campylobacter sp. RM9334]